MLRCSAVEIVVISMAPSLEVPKSSSKAALVRALAAKLLDKINQSIIRKCDKVILTFFLTGKHRRRITLPAALHAQRRTSRQLYSRQGCRFNIFHMIGNVIQLFA